MRRIRSALRALAGDRRGLAMIEFALSAPLLLLLGLGGVEVAQFAIANLRVSQIALTTADNAGRVRDQISEDDVNELMTGAFFVGRGINFAANGRIILSDLEPQSSGAAKQWIRWQRCAGALNKTSSYGGPLNSSGGAVTDLSDASKAATDYGAVETKSTMTAMGPAGNQIAAIAGTAVMFVEVTYTYQPLMSNYWLGPRTITYNSAFNVRQRTDQNLKTRGLTYTKFSRCTVFSATPPG